MAYDIGGYPQDRFQSAVDKNFFCPICTEVLKEPLQCHNQHYFCAGCITEHLKNSKTCPMCVEKLTDESLSKPPRIVMDYLNGLLINCDNSERGCTETMEVGSLKNHTPVCNYRPVVCPHEKCETTVNMNDLEEHKSTSCEYRLVHCDECDEDMSVKKYGKHVCSLYKDVQEIKMVLVDMKGQITRQDQKLDEIVTLVQNLTSKGDKMTLSEAQHAIPSNDPELSSNILVLGGYDGDYTLKCAELYSVNDRTWTILEPMLEARSSFSAHYYKDQVLVAGGFSDDLLWLNTMECLKRKDGSLSWTRSLAKLPFESEGHQSVIVDDHLMVIGGRGEEGCSFNHIHKIQLSPPFASTFESCLPQPLAYHGVESFGNDILIFGGTTELGAHGPVKNVWLYNIIKRKFTPVLPLRKAISDMATVKCGDDVLIIGGEDKGSKALNTVFKYNYKKSTCDQLPSMKYCRKGCAAVLSENKVYVMGGFGHWQRNANRSKDVCLSSIERFDLDRQEWEELPPMNKTNGMMDVVLIPANF